MKTENTLNNKQRYFFATGTLLKAPIGFSRKESRELLEQTSRGLVAIENLTKEDAERAAEILGIPIYPGANPVGETQKTVIDEIKGIFEGISCDYSGGSVLMLVDFLRPSYALPWNDLSLEDLKEYGWLSISTR